ncbi:MAG: CpsD/CapB family tyrosine-protein kinase [Desulfobaccales bacterium]
MSFIDKALEKARQLTARESPPAEGPRPETEPPLPPPGTPVGEIRYTVTRTVPVDREWLRRHRVITPGEHDPVLEAYKLLRTQILQRTRPEGKNLLMVTGPQPGEGKTLTAVNLAVSLSREVDTTVLLVDADLRSPSVHTLFGLRPEGGLANYLRGERTIPELLLHPEGFPRFVLLPGGRPVAEAAELVSSPMMAALVQELKHYYPDRYVIFDLPPLLPYADALAFAPRADGIILVVEQGRTTREDLARSLELLKDFPVLGTVLNKATEEPGGYYYPAAGRASGKGDGRSWWAGLKERLGLA